MASQIFCRYGLADQYTSSVFHYGLFPVNSDLLSLEIPSFFRDVFVVNDNKDLQLVLNSFDILESVAGKVPLVQGFGSVSRRVLRIIAARGETNKRDKESATMIPKVSRVIFFDRMNDFVTPLLTPLTYETLLDEVRQASS